MTPVVVLAIVASLVSLFLISQVVRFSRRGALLTAHAAQLTPVDLEAFENLTDPEEERFLRMSLSPAEFRKVQRLRIRAAKLYLAAISHNAGVLIAVGQSARSHANSELVQRALQLKFWCFFADLRMDAAFVFPSMAFPSHQLASEYMVVSYMAANMPERAAA